MVHKLTAKRKRSLRRTKRRSNGGGYSDGPGYISAGYLEHVKYPGIGKDCTGNPDSIRPGYITDYTSKGLPGWSGGKRRKVRGRRRGGAMADSITPLSKWMSNPGGSGGTVGQPNVVFSMPGVSPGGAHMPKVALDSAASGANLSAQKGGRYGFFPEMGPLNPANGVGVSPAPFGRIPCEVGTSNPLNLDPNNIQKMSTAPLTPPFVSGRLAGGGSGFSAANFPTVQVGQADAMRYYAPNAGYTNEFMTFRAPSAVPGLTVPVGYPAGAFNQACIKTGGSRKNRRRRGGVQMPVAFDAGKFSPVTMDEIWTRKDFDGSDKLLPVKFGGKRRTRRNRRN
jgi:hypothetical protein